jgi:hypothetical protein
MFHSIFSEIIDTYLVVPEKDKKTGIDGVCTSIRAL